MKAARTGNREELMEIHFSIRVVDADGDGIEGAKVAVHYPWTHDSDYTDDEGWVQFEKETTPWDGIRTTVYVNGELEAEEIWIEDGDTFSFTISG